jgi:hypothetical protein
MQKKKSSENPEPELNFFSGIGKKKKLKIKKIIF